MIPKHAESGTAGIPRRAFNNPRAMESFGSSNLSNQLSDADFEAGRDAFLERNIGSGLPFRPIPTRTPTARRTLTAEENRRLDEGARESASVLTRQRQEGEARAAERQRLREERRRSR
jgi:hypothetical protein